MKRVFFFIQILFLIALFSGGNRNIEAGNVNISSLPSQAPGIRRIIHNWNKPVIVSSPKSHVWPLKMEIITFK